MLAYYVHDLQPFIFSFNVDLDFFFIHIHGPIGPRWYGMAYVLAFLCAYALLRRLAKRGYMELPVARVADFVTWAALFGVMLGGRLGYVFFYRPEMLREPLSILRVWEGGMSSHGGIIGLFLFTLYYARRHHLSWTNLGDNLVVVSPIGIFFGRCANFINGELYGRATNVPWAMQFPKELLEPQNATEAERAVAACEKIDPALTSPDAIVAALHHNPRVKEILRGILTPRHPSQIYEALCEGVILFLILWIVRTKFRTRNGVLTGLFFICYALLRIFVETFREPDASLILGITRGQFFSIFLILIGMGFLLAARLGKTQQSAP